MDNHNNLSYCTDGKEKNEPFAFTLDELPNEINKVQMTHLYRADFTQFEERKFLEKIFQLILPYI